ncbi:MAG: hypothetical protein ABS84_14920 [Rubrivivax sp. SCN 71-131]|nr:MAG: hypothetical protein ABS84_14920 [Rubrivivax sp. SCN 71-131]
MTQDVKLKLSVSGQAEVVSAAGQVESAVNKAAGAARNLAAAGLGLLALDRIAGVASACIQTADAVAVLGNQLKLATGSAAAASSAYEALFGIAQRSRVGFVELGGTFAAITRSAGDLGISQRRLLTVTEAIGNAMTVSGGSAAGMQAALVQLGQGMASGTLRGDELNSVMEQTPRLAKAIADGMGVTIGQLRAMGQEGLITSETVVKALESQAGTLAGEVQDSVVTVGQAMTQLGNVAVKLVGQIDKASGATSGLASAAQKSAGELERLAEIMRYVERAGGGFIKQLSAAAGLAITRTVFGTLGEAAGLTNFAINALTGGVLKLNENVSVMPLVAMTAAEQYKVLGQRITEAEIKLKDLYAQAKTAPENIYIKSEISDLEKYIAQLNIARIAKGNLQGAGAGRGFVNPETVGEAAARKAAKQARAEEQLNAIRNKALGVNKEWVESLRTLDALHTEGMVADQDRLTLAQSLTAATYKTKGANVEAASAYAALDAEIARTTRSIDAKAAAGGKLTEAQKLELSLTEKIAAASAKLTVQQQAQLRAQAAVAVAKQRAEDDAQTALDLAGRVAKANEEQRQLREQEARDMDDYQNARQKRFADDETYASQRLQYVQDDIAATALARAANISLGEAVQQVALANMEAARAALANDAQALASLDRQIAKQRELINLVGQQAAEYGLQQLYDASAVQNFASEFEAAFGRAGGAVASLMGVLDQYGQKQQELAKLEAAAAAKGPAEHARFAQVAAQQQIKSYGDMAAAARGFFKAGSSGYKALEKTEKAFRAVELALAVKTAAEKIGLIAGVTAAKVSGDAAQAASATASVAPEVAASMAKGQAAATAGVANQAGGDPYTAFFRMAAMAAIMAALGFATKGSSGAAPTSAAQRQKDNGTGTVLGDAEAKSQSIAKSINRLADSAQIGLAYQSGMLAALRNIEAALSGVGTQVLRAGGINTGKNLGIAQGVVDVHSGRTAINMGTIMGTIMGDPVVGAITNKLLREVDKVLGPLWGKTKQEIVDAGLSIQGTVGQLSGGQGVRQYADVQTTKSSWFGLKKDKSFDTIYGDVGADVARQFGLVFQSLGDILQSSAVQLGRDGQAVADAVSGFVVDITALSLKDLKGDELQQAIAVAIGAQADTIAQTALPGLEAFQQVGEGYFETLTRVASATETATYQLDLLSLSAIDLGDVARKQGDVAAEIVRQSIGAAESVGGVLNNVGQIIATLDGTAESLAAAYAQLTDVRDLLRSVGSSGDALSVGMIRGAGGLDKLGGGLSAYLEGFFTEAERTAAGMARLGEQFARLGVEEMPTTREAFRALVESIDPSTDAGARMFAQLVGLSDAFAAVVPAAESAARSLADIASERYNLETQLLQLQGRTAELRQRELDLIDPSNRALQQQVWALQDAQAAAQNASKAWQSAGNAASDAADRVAQAWQAAWKTIADEITRLRGGDAKSAASLQADFEATTAAARAGDTSAAARLPGLSKQLAEELEKTARSRTEFDIMQSRMAASLENTLRATGAGSPYLQSPAQQAQQAAGFESLAGEIQQLREDLTAANATIANYTRRTAQVLERASPDGDAFAMRSAPP